MDFITAKHYPEIVKKQNSIIAIYDDVDDRVIIESLIASSAEFEIFKKDIENSTKLLSVVDFSKYKIDPEYYVHLYKIYKNEHYSYPTLLLSRSKINECDGNFNKLVDTFQSRMNFVNTIGWDSTTSKGKSFKLSIKRFHELQDIAIHEISDDRLKHLNENISDIIFNDKKI